MDNKVGEAQMSSKYSMFDRNLIIPEDIHSFMTMSSLVTRNRHQDVGHGRRCVDNIVKKRKVCVSI